MPSSTSSPVAATERDLVRGKGFLKKTSPLRSVSRNTSLTLPQAIDLVNGLCFGESLLPKDMAWAHTIVVLEQSTDFIPGDARACTALQARILRSISTFLRSHGLPAMYLGVREVAGYGEHSHTLLPIPPHLRADLEAVIRKVGRLHDTSNNLAVVIAPRKDRQTGEDDTRGIYTPAMRRGVLLDLLKTMSPKAILNGVRVMPALGIRHRASCVIHGKRVFLSQNLHRKARAVAHWQELVTLDELRAALGGVIEEAKRERGRRKQRRYSARKAAGATPAPRHPSAPPKPASGAPGGLDDLSQDFME